MEDLIPIIVFLIIGAVSILSKWSKSGKGGGSRSDYEKMMDQTEVDQTQDWQATEFYEDLVLEEGEWGPESTRPPAIRTLTPGDSQEKQLGISRKEVADQSRTVEPKRSTVLGGQSRDDLRRAIVWSEILGPPVALRDSYRHQR